jgi:hypothetical protein
LVPLNIASTEESPVALVLEVAVIRAPEVVKRDGVRAGPYRPGFKSKFAAE